MTPRERLGAFPEPGGTRFAVWTTQAQAVEVRLFDGPTKVVGSLPLAHQGDGLFEELLPEVAPGALYKLALDGRELPDPYARFLPFGVHGPAEVLAARPAAPGRLPPLHALSIYELHLGTFTPEGNYRAAAAKLPQLVELGLTTVELLPLSAFPGARGWGYDGVASFAPFAPYGRPDDLRFLIAEAHRLGLTVLLDVVYNHFGPSGSYLGAYAPEYFHASATNPWGAAPNYAHPRMRAFVLENVRYWFEEFGFDGLRLDATHTIEDPSPIHILKAIATVAHDLPVPRLVIAEDDRNQPALVTEAGLDAIWADDFHHQVQVLLTGEQDGYYGCYAPTVAALATTIERGWIYQGQPYGTEGRPRGFPADALAPERFVYCLQNHDQIGNRALGTRLTHDASPEAVEAAMALLLFLPMVPMLFMGEEWAASSPFLFFTDHDAELGPKVSEGRRAEFAKFKAFADPAVRERIPDPQAAETFERSKLRWDERSQGAHARMLALVKQLLALRRQDPVLREPCARAALKARAQGDLLIVERTGAAGKRCLLSNFGSVAIPHDLERHGRLLLATGPHAGAQVEPHTALWLAS